MTILTYIQQLLDEKDQPSTLIEANQEAPYDRLLVAFASDKGQEDLLEITAHPQVFEGAFTKENVSDLYYLLQFQYVLPIDVTSSHFNQISSCLHFFNRLLHCPGFELDELNDKVLYRYVWFIKKKGIDAFLLMQVLGNLQLCFKMFSPYIKEIAEGRYTLEEILEKAMQLTQQKPHKKSSPPVN